MSSLVAQHIANSASTLEADDFPAFANYSVYEDVVDDDDDGSQQVEDIFEDDNSEDGEDMVEEYVADGDDKSNDVDDDDDDDASSVSEGEESDVEIIEACDDYFDSEICESVDVEETEDVLSSEHSEFTKGKSANTSKNSSVYYMLLLLIKFSFIV